MADHKTVFSKGFGSENIVDGIVFDITSIKQAEKKQKSLQDQLNHAQKMESVGRLAGGVAHDFNNMLSIILGYSEILISDLPEDHPNRAELEAIHSAGMRSRSLTRQLLTFARKQVLEMKLLDLNDALRGFDKMLRRLIREDIELDLELTEEPLPIKADISQLEQVMMNLAVNARDAMPEGGRLTFETEKVEFDEADGESGLNLPPGCYAQMKISDSGTGMDPETSEKCFDPFFTTKEAGKGTGLGLSTLYGIVIQHGGTVKVYSEPGVGTTFKLYLPLSQEGKLDKKADKHREMLSGSGTVLVVEDEPAVRKMACGILKRNGYTVIESTDVENALDLARDCKDPIHLVLSDVVMPVMKGPEVYERVREHHPEARCLFMSGYSESLLDPQGVLKKGIPFIQKPFSLDQLLLKVKQALKATQGDAADKEGQ